MQIKWTHNGIFISTNTRLLINYVNESDRGEYVCTAKNEYGVASFRFDLNVLSQPESIDGIDGGVPIGSNQCEVKLIVEKGESVLVKCPVRNNSEPEIYRTDEILDRIDPKDYRIVLSDGALVSKRSKFAKTNTNNYIME